MAISLYSWSRENARSVECLALMLFRFLRAVVSKTEAKTQNNADRTRSPKTTTARHFRFETFPNCIGKARSDRFGQVKSLESVS